MCFTCSVWLKTPSWYSSLRPLWNPLFPSTLLPKSSSLVVVGLLDNRDTYYVWPSVRRLKGKEVPFLFSVLHSLTLLVLSWLVPSASDFSVSFTGQCAAAGLSLRGVSSQLFNLCLSLWCVPILQPYCIMKHLHDEQFSVAFKIKNIHPEATRSSGLLECALTIMWYSTGAGYQITIWLTGR